jgi:NADPH:quinone reductase-like Zn-dependent oxidoreductase
MDKKVKTNHRVLVTGSNGNIGRAVVELSKRAGALVYASCKRDHREFMLNVIGADEWLNEDPTTWRDNLSVDIIIDCVCFTGNPKYLLRFLCRNGVKLVNVGNSRGLKRKMLKQMQQAGELYDIDEFLAEEPSTFCGIQFMPKEIKKEDIYKQDSGSLFPKIGTAMHAVTPLPFRSNIYDYNLFESIEQRQDLMADDLSLLFNLLETGIIRPTIALEVGLHQIQQAQELVEAGGLQGAIICRP